MKFLKIILIFSLLFFLLIIPSSNAVPSGGVSYYNFNDQVIDQWNGNDGINNGVNFSSNFPSFNLSGNGYNLSGDFLMVEKDYITMDNITANNITDTGGSMSVWFQQKNYTNDARIISLSNGYTGITPGDDRIIEILTYNNYFCCRLYAHPNTGDSTVIKCNTDDISDDTDWHNMVMTWSNDTYMTGCWLDGEKIGSDSYYSHDISSINTSTVGNTNWRGSYTATYFNGYVDELKFFERNITDEEIINLYNYGSIYSPPIITNHVPINESHQIIPVVFNGTVIDNDFSTLNCSLIINSTNAYNFTDVLNNTYLNVSINFTDYNFSSGQVYEWFYSCNNSEIVTNSTHWEFEADFGNPTIIEYVFNNSPTFNVAGTVNITMNTLLHDVEDNLFAYQWNITDNTTIFYTETLVNYSGSNITINNIIPIDNITVSYPKTLYFNIFVEDWHTLLELKNSNTKKDEKNKKIIFTYKNISVANRPDDISKIKNYSFKKLSDRVMDTYCFNDYQKGVKKNRVFYFESPEIIYYNRDSKYDAHFVTSHVWRDYSLKNYVDETYKVEKINDYKYKIIITSSQECLTFKSFGGLNSAYKSFDFTLIHAIPNATIENITTEKEGLQSFSNGTILSTYANVSIGNITFFIYDANLNYSNATLTDINGSIITSVINQSILSFNLSSGTYNVSVFAINRGGYNNSDNGYFFVQQCVENWERIDDGCNYPENTNTIIYADSNNCGTFQNVPDNNGTSENCTYAGVEGDINCVYNPKPFIKTLEKIEWLCYLNNTGATITTCNTYVMFNNSIIQTNPNPEYVKDVGMVNYFTAQPTNAEYQTVNVYFDNKDLRHESTVTFVVRCNSASTYYNFEANVTPQFKEFSRTIGDRGIWIGNNIVPIIVFIIFLFIVAVIVGMAIKYYRQG